MADDQYTLLSKLEQQYDLPSGILTGVMQTESGGREVLGPVLPGGQRASGAFQFLPDTAKKYGVKSGDFASEATGAAKYLSDLLKSRGGDAQKALADYGGFKSKDPSSYIDRVAAYAPSIKQSKTEMASSDVPPWEQNWGSPAPASDKPPWEQEWGNAPVAVAAEAKPEPQEEKFPGGSFLDKIKWAAAHTNWQPPELLMAPLRGIESRSADLMGQGKPIGDTSTTPDDLAAVAAFATPSPAFRSGNALAAISAANSPATPISEAIEAGYRIPPAMARGGAPVGNALQSLSGQFKTEQLASLKNQPVTNALAKQAIGVDPETSFTPQVFQNVRKEAGKAYEDVQTNVPELTNDATFRETVTNLGGRMTEAAREFPELLANPELEKLSDTLANKETFSSKAAIQLVRKLRSQASTNFKAFDKPMQQELAHAQREAADAIDDLIERNLERLSAEGSDFEARLPTDLVAKYRQARKRMAMSHDIEDATNSATGDVNALDLARMAEKGRPFTNQLKTISKTAQAFGPAMREPIRGASPFTWFDAMLGLGGLHNPYLTAGVLARPLAREFILSKPYQNMLSGR